MDFKIGSWNIRGLSTTDKQNEVRNFIENEKLSICAVLETHLKSQKLQKIGDKVFGVWEWVDNLRMCDKGCRILIGWNNERVNLSIIHMARQSVLCKVKDVNGKLELYCTFVYATNGGADRKILWEDLGIYKRIVGNMAWVLFGDMNVTLAPNEHSAGSSCMTTDM